MSDKGVRVYNYCKHCACKQLYLQDCSICRFGEQLNIYNFMVQLGYLRFYFSILLCNGLSFLVQ